MEGAGIENDTGDVWPMLRRFPGNIPPWGNDWCNRQGEALYKESGVGAVPEQCDKKQASRNKQRSCRRIS